jgi:uncharacterized peroxidase-related enzyme
MAYMLAVDPAQNEALAELEKKAGPSNFLRVMANHPRAMTDFLALYRTVMGHGSIERRLKEMIYLAVSSVNECSYCTSHHAKTAKAAGLTDEEIHTIAMENDQGFSEKEQAALKYARELTRTAAADESIRYPVEELFTGEQLIEITMIIGLANFTNRFNNGLAVPNEHASHAGKAH